MKTSEILREIRRLPVSKRIYLVEKTIREIRKEKEYIQMQKAAEELFHDYVSDHELTDFTKIDFEDFYEAR